MHPQQMAARAALASQKTVLAFPYFSTVRFNAARTGAGPYVYTIAAGTRKCFNYKIGDQPTGAGFASTYTVGKTETNLLKASETRDNADVYIWGIAAELCSNSDAYMAKQVWRNAYVELALSGTDQHLLGPLSFFPGGGGLYGMGDSTVIVPSAIDSVSRAVGHLNNGNPTAGNYYRLPQPLIWQANGSGAKDTSLVISVTVDSAIATGSVTARSATAPSSGSTGQLAFDPPADGTVFVDVRFRLVSVSVSQRSANV